MRKLFGTAGIRGRYLKEITPELALSLGSAVASALRTRKVCIGGDARLTTPLLKSLVASGCMMVGSDVIDADLIPMPILPWCIRRFKCDAGIYVTASHNPPTDNGFKVFSSRGMELTLDEERIVEEVLRSRSWSLSDWNLVGRLIRINGVISDYIEDILSRLEPKSIKYRPKILIDTANGAASQVTPQLLKSLGAEVYTMNANIDGRFPGRIPEPRPDVLEPFIPIARELGVDVFFAHDGDGDRLAIIDPELGFMKQDRVLALIAYYKLSERRGTVVVSIDCGNALKDIVEKLGGKLIITKLGKTHEGLLKYNDVVLAGEPWKLIDPSWGPWVDGIYQAALITKLMIEEGKNLRELFSKVPNYPQARYSVLMDEEVRNEVYNYLTDYIINGLPRRFHKKITEVLDIDGIRVNFEDKSWILVRKSGTEPKIRFYGESLNASDLKVMFDELIKSAVKKAREVGSKIIKVEGSLIP